MIPYKPLPLMSARTFADIRRRLRLTQADLANLLGLDVVTVNRYERQDETAVSRRGIPPVVRILMRLMDEDSYLVRNIQTTGFSEDPEPREPVDRCPDCGKPAEFGDVCEECERLAIA